MKLRVTLAIAAAAVLALVAFSSIPTSKTSAQLPPPVTPGVASIGRIPCLFDGAPASWRTNNLTYSIIGGEFYGQPAVQAVRNAFASWTRAAGYNFTEVQGGANITVSLYPSLILFGGSGTLGLTDLTASCLTFELGMSSTSIDIGSAISGLVLNGTFIENVARHEIGHALGLDHSNVVGDLMFPFFSPAGAQRVICPSTLDLGALKASTSRALVFNQSLLDYREGTC